MLKLPVPEADYENVVLKPSEYQQDMVHSLADRAEAVRDRKVQPNIDNMLKITNDGRKLALDQRLINAMLPDEENSKATTCVEKAFEIWEQTKEQKSAQLIFCDLSTPKGDGTFNVYEDIRDKLMAKGVPENDGEQEEMDTEEMEREAEAVADAPFKPQINRAVSEKVAEHGKERMLSDSPRGRISVKEKLAEMRRKAYGQKMPEKPEIQKSKGKEETL